MRKFMILLAVFLVVLFAGCSNNKPETETTTETTTELTTVEITEEITEKETEENTTKAPETTKPKPQPTQPKPTQPKPTEPKPTKPSGGGQFTFDDGPAESGVYIQDPDTDAADIDKDAELNGWNTDWELN